MNAYTTSILCGLHSVLLYMVFCFLMSYEHHLRLQSEKLKSCQETVWGKLGSPSNHARREFFVHLAHWRTGPPFAGLPAEVLRWTLARIPLPDGLDKADNGHFVGTAFGIKTQTTFCNSGAIFENVFWIKSRHWSIELRVSLLGLQSQTYWWQTCVRSACVGHVGTMASSPSLN